MKQWMKIGVFLGLLVGMVQMAVASEAPVRSCAWAEQSLAACVQQPAWNQQSGEVLVAVATVATRYDAESLFGRAVDFACRFIDEKGNIEGLDLLSDADAYAAARFLVAAYDRTGDKRFRRAIEQLYLRYEARGAAVNLDTAPFLAQYARRFGKRKTGDVRSVLYPALVTLLRSAMEECPKGYTPAQIINIGMDVLDFIPSKESGVKELRSEMVAALTTAEASPEWCRAALKALRTNRLRSAYRPQVMQVAEQVLATPPHKNSDTQRVAAVIGAAVEYEALVNCDCAATGALLPAFPGAEGGGRYTTGGRGGRVLTVTSLADDGSQGTLRWALEARGARIVVFAVGGTIELRKPLKISFGDLTIAGQTAPGEGVTVRNFGVDVGADNIIIRYMRFRMGDKGGAQSDALSGKGCRNIIIDHCSMSWSTDECASFYANRDFTMQWCILSESLAQSVHDKGSHGYGAIWGGRNATYHHNLLAHHTSRNPRLDHPVIYGEELRLTHRGTVEVVNNVIYNWGFKACYGGEEGWWNFIGNYYKPGAGTTARRGRFVEASINRDTGHTIGSYFIGGNVVEGSPEVSRSNWRGVEVEGGFTAADADHRTPFMMPGGAFEATSAQEAYRAVLEKVGASLQRDAIDRRLIEEVERGTTTYRGSRSGAAGHIDSQEDVGGWPSLRGGKAPKDSDGDGMPDAWEEAQGLDATDAADGALTLTEGGYTHVERYLNSLVQ